MKRLVKLQYLFILFIALSTSACITSFDIGPDQPCGNGQIDKGEQCDDGNSDNDDACSNSCTINSGWKCIGNSCITTCGDGIKAGDEQCDDKNKTNGDGCDENCRIEPKAECHPQDSSDPSSTSRCLKTEQSNSTLHNTHVSSASP